MVYDCSKPNNYIINLDVNNLYGKCLNMFLPVKDFKFLNPEEYNEINWENIDTDNEKGYIIECDLLYDQSLHDLHKDFPLAPHRHKVNNN